MAFIDYVTVVASMSDYDKISGRATSFGKTSFDTKRAIIRLSRSARSDKDVLKQIEYWVKNGWAHVSRLDLAQDYAGLYDDQVEKVLGRLSVTIGVFKVRKPLTPERALRRQTPFANQVFLTCSQKTSNARKGIKTESEIIHVRPVV